ncbi:MAG: alkaline phosphatase [Bacteroidetes bacterium]|nr:alkaline phosphatase [Bacteroidota bacterium]
MIRVLFLGLFLLSSCNAQQSGVPSSPVTGSVIFIHPDGSGSGMWTALRMLDRGPDGMTEWDRLDRMGLYRGHQRFAASTSSHAGATAHAYGVKVPLDTYGNVHANPVRSASNKDYSIMVEAMKAGLPIGVVNSGHLCEPGTGVFLASSFSRYSYDSISTKIIESGADVLFGGGEVMLLPEGVIGRHGKPGNRKDGRNLIERAKELGYEIVYTREELKALPDDAQRVLGVFAAWNTFNDMTEEKLAERGLPLYTPSAPTLAEMTEVALRILSRKGERFLLVVEEEGSDNFANDNNAKGSIEALRRADAAIGVARGFVERHPRTLLLTGADSDAGGMSIWGMDDETDPSLPLPASSKSGGAMDGIEGTATLPFVSAPDAAGRRLPFGIAWAGEDDMQGHVIARAHGANAQFLTNNVQNTDMYHLMYLTLFGRWPEGSGK